MTAPSVTLTSYILAPWNGTYETGDKIALSYADLSFVPSASDSFKSTSGDIFKVYVDGVRIYRRSDQDYASGYGFLEDGDNSSGVKLNGLTGTVNGNTVSWNSTTDNVWTIDTANQKIYLDVSEVQATDLYGNGTGAKNVTFTPNTTTITLSRAVQDLKTPAIDFANASILTEQDLDNSAKNVFHTAQQAVISTENAMLYSESTDAYSAAAPGSAVAKRIKNVQTPSDPNDAANKAYVDGGSDVQTVAGLSTEIALLGTSEMATATTGHIPVLAESSYKSKIETVAETNYKAKVEAVAGKETEVGLLGTSAMATATTGHIPVLANVVEQTVNYTVTVASSKFNIQGGEYGTATETPALTLIRGYTYVFDTSDSTVATHPLVFKNGSATLGTSDGVTTDSASPGSTGAKVTVVVSDSVTITKYSCSTHGDGMGNTITLRHDDFKEVADNKTNVTTVAGQITPTNNIATVAGLTSELSTVTNSTYKGQIETVAGATYKDAIETVAESTYKGLVETVGESGYKAKVEAVGATSAINAINTINTNINAVTDFGDTYHTAGTTAPSGSNVTQGDLWFDTNTGVKSLKVYDGSSWNLATSSIATVASQNEFTASDGQGTDNKYFSLAHDVGLEMVFLNGVRLKRGNDYYCTNSNTSTTPIASGGGATFIRLETVPSTNDILSVMAFGQIANNLAVNTAGGTFTGAVTFEGQNTHNTGSNTFTMPTTRGTDAYVLTRDDSVGTGGTAWKETVIAPTFTSMTGVVNEDDQTTLTINGDNFASGMSIHVYNNSATKLTTTALTYNLVSATQITVDIPNNTSTNGFPIASGTSIFLRITKSGFNVDTSNVTVSADPAWGSISSPYVAVGNGKTGNVGSALPEPTISSGSGTISYTMATQPSDNVNKYSVNSSRQLIVQGASNSGAGNLASTSNPKTDVISVRATGPQGASQVSDLTVNIAVYQTMVGITSSGISGVNSGDYTYYTFPSSTTSGAITIANNASVGIDVLIVAGGASGGGAETGTYGYYSGGGGGGQVIAISGWVIPSGTWDVTVGAAKTADTGAGADAKLIAVGATFSQGNSTTSTTNDTLVASGGGTGGIYDTSHGVNGGSGGGGSGGNTSSMNGGSSNKTSVATLNAVSGVTATSYGNTGGSGSAAVNSSYIGAGGGGGGASAQGGSATSASVAGAGGAGYTWVDNKIYGAGGGGGVKSASTPGQGGSSLGGTGGVNSTGGNATATTVSGDTTANGAGHGGGGAGGASSHGGDGGAGIVIFRVPRY